MSGREMVHRFLEAVLQHWTGCREVSQQGKPVLEPIAFHNLGKRLPKQVEPSHKMDRLQERWKLELGGLKMPEQNPA